VVVASGPFTHSDAMTYEPLHALVQYVKQHKPHVLILIGPFVEEAHASVQKGVLEVTFEAFFTELVTQLLTSISRYVFQIAAFGTRVIFYKSLC
jgi:DNA polymerase alpha subunit B